MSPKPIPSVVWLMLLTVLFMDASLATMISRQLRASSWPVVDGVIADVRQERAAERLMDCPAVTFRYRVDGEEHTSSRFRPGRFCSTSWQAVQAIADGYVVGSTVPVYVNPDDPSEAYLDAGIGRIEQLGLFALLPFNLFALGWMLEIVARKAFGTSLTKGVTYEEQGGDEVAVLPAVGPLSFALGVALVASLPLSLAVTFTFEHLSPRAFTSIWLVLLALVVSAFLFKLVWNRKRRRTIRLSGGSVLLPDGTRVERADVRGVGVRSGESRPPHPTYYKPLLLTRQGGLEGIELCELPSSEDADRLAAWLESNLDLGSAEEPDAEARRTASDDLGR